MTARRIASWLLAKKTIWLLVGISCLSALGFALLDQRGAGLQGWWSYVLLLLFGCGVIYSLGCIFHVDKRVMVIAFTAFGLRLLVGVALSLLLPVYGYQDENAEVTKAGYVFYDAYIRDGQAWKLAYSPAALGEAFTGQFSGDQYGGLLALSAALYRYLSPDAQRPWLVLILGATFAGLGVLFLWKASRSWFGDKVANLAAWIFALYPESVLLGSSQMREPFVFTGVAIAFYALTEMRKKHGWIAGLIMAAAILFWFQPPLVVATFMAVFGLWLGDPERQASWRRIFLFAGILVAGVIVVFSIWASLPALRDSSVGSIFFTWLEKNFNLQFWFTIRESGQVQKLVKTIGKDLKLLVVLGYGVSRPVLPAALADFSGALIWRVINILRALGWYALAPFLVYGLFASFRSLVKERRSQLIWLSLFIWIWVCISAMNGGADLWDNPRYRTFFIAWEALLAAWAWHSARSWQDAWLGRWLIVEAGWVLIFTEWYVTRVYLKFLHPNILLAIAGCLALAVLVLGGGWWRHKHRKGLISHP